MKANNKVIMRWFGALIYFLVLGSLLLSTQTRKTEKGIETDSDSIVSFVTEGSEFRFENQWAFIIGIDKYSHIRNLTHAVSETQKLKEILAKKYGFIPIKKKWDHPYRKVEYLCNQDATANVIMLRLNWYQHYLEAEDSLFIYFSGHGYVDETKDVGYWLPHDIGTDVGNRKYLTDEDIMKSSKVKIGHDQIAEFLKNCKAKHIFVVVDACYAGAGKMLFQYKGGPPTNLIKKKSIQLLAASTGNIPDPSPFSEFLIQSLEQNQKPYLIASSLISMAREKLGNKFTPIGGHLPLLDSDQGEFVFVLTDAASIYYYNQGYDYDEKGEYIKAIDFYRKAVKIQPKNIKAYNNMGIVFRKQGKFPEAIEAFEKALEINPTYAKAYYNIGCTYDELKQFPKAIDYYKKSIKRKPVYDDAYNNMGVVYFRLTEYRKALKAFKKAVKINPGHPTAHCNLSYVYKKLGDTAKAAKAKKMCKKLAEQYK